jgi:predicted nucleic acid-binding protein
MNLVLDSGGVTSLAGQRARLAELRRRGAWPPQVPTVVLVEVLTGDHRRDFHENHLLRMCQIRPVDEQTARDAARMRIASGRADDISATDAIVAAFAVSIGDSVVLTSDPTDLGDLVKTQSEPVTISAV